MAKIYTVETGGRDGWMDNMDGFGENSTEFSTRAEAEEALKDAIAFSTKKGYKAEFISSLHVFESEIEGAE